MALMGLGIEDLDMNADCATYQFCDIGMLTGITEPQLKHKY